MIIILNILVTGIEPATICLKGIRSTKLSYTSHNQIDYGLKYACDGNRTHDHTINSRVLYQLSYTSHNQIDYGLKYQTLLLVTGFEPATICLKGIRSTKLSYTSHNQSDYGLKYQTFSHAGN